MARSPDATLPPNERLILRFERDHVQGPYVLEQGIDVEGHSCSRESRITELDSVRTEREPELAYALPRELPQLPWTRGDAVDDPWEFFAVDDPTDENDAHAEIRNRRLSKRPDPRNDTAGHKGKSSLRDKLRATLADVLHVIDAQGNAIHR